MYKEKINRKEKFSMNYLYPLCLAAGAAGLLAVGLNSPAPAASGGRTPVIVELFTSEGCSSCPPADAVLTGLIKKQPVPGAEVIALGEHVDYWNHGGWADPFSSAKYSARQSGYSRSFGKDNVYTPQMIVDGRTEFVGSDDDRARQEIAQAAHAPKADVQVAKSGPNRLSVLVDHLPASAKSDAAEVILAVTEDGLASSVGGGENSGRHLIHSAVVRQLRVLGTTSGGVFTATPTVTPGQGWRHDHLHAVVFVQERGSRRIVGAVQVDL